MSLPAPPRQQGEPALKTQRDAYALLREHYSPSSATVRAYNALRLAVLPVPWLSGLLQPLRGTTLCLGCGFGTLETVLAAANPQLDLVASDFNDKRIHSAQVSVRGLPNITFTVSDATQVQPEGSYDNVFFSDLLHHLPEGEQEILLDKMWRVIRPGGALVVKDVDDSPRWKYWWNYAHDKVVAGQPLTYRPRAHYVQHLRGLGAEVTESVPRTRLPYAHYALIATKPARP